MPTRQILLTLGEDVLEVEGLIPANGRFVATASQVRVNGAEVTLPVTLSRDIVAGDFVTPVFLEVTPQPYWWLWFLVIRDEEDTVMLRRTVAVPPGSTDPIAFGDLLMIDPRTLEPTAEPEAAWWLAVQPFIDAYNAGELKGDQGDPGPPGGPGPQGESAYEVAVDNGFVGTEAEWLASLEGPQGDPGPTGPSGMPTLPAATSAADADAITTAGVWKMELPDGFASWGAYSGVSNGNAYTAPGTALLMAEVTNSSSGTIISQQLFVAEGSSFPIRMWRRKVGATAWTAWSGGVRVSSPNTANNFEVVNILTLENRFTFGAIHTWANTAEFDAYDLDAARGSILSGITDMGVYTGIAEYNGLFVGIPLVEYNRSSDYPQQGANQRIYFVDLAGEFVTIERSRFWTSPAAAPAWSAWAKVEIPIPEPGLKQYASTAEIDAVTEAEIGVYRFPDVAAQSAFFGAGGAQMFAAADIYFESMMSNNYGDGYFPTDNGRVQQTAHWTDGWGDNKTLSRYRGYDAVAGTWFAWSAWEVLPIPGFRPAAKSLWQAGTLVDGNDDDWVRVLTADLVPSGEATPWDYVAQHWDVMFADADKFALLGGRLQMRSAASAAFQFEGILDATRTDVGTTAYGARNTGDVARQVAHVDTVAAAAGVNAVAGFHIPLDIATRPGLLFHATFAFKSGMTSASRLLAGLVATTNIATAMSDVDPSAIGDFFGAGYGSADTNVKAFQRATSTLAESDSGQAVSTSANQMIDLKAWIGPNNNALYLILTVRTGSTIVRKQQVLGSGINNASALSFFIRASAGGTSATPRIALHRLRIGNGFGAVAGN